jgi:hypothetical protein
MVAIGGEPNNLAEGTGSHTITVVTGIGRQLLPGPLYSPSP